MPRAVLLDALGTLLRLEPPAPRLRAALAAAGAVVSPDQARAAVAAEIAYYRAHLGDGRDAAGLAELRRRCAAVMAEALPPPARALGPAVLLDCLLRAIRFTPYPEVPDVLRALRAAGARVVVVSNWDVSLHEALAATGLAPLVDGALSSAEVGAAKPDRRIFDLALELAGARAADAVHAGDSVEADVHGAIAAGITPVLVHREGEAVGAPPPGVRVVRDLRPLAGPYA